MVVGVRRRRRHAAVLDVPMFHTERCVFAAFLGTGKDHRDCGRPCEAHKVELQNRVPQSAAESVGRMRELGLRMFRVDRLRETRAEVAPLSARRTRRSR
jgi:putative protease